MTRHFTISLYIFSAKAPALRVCRTAHSFAFQVVGFRGSVRKPHRNDTPRTAAQLSLYTRSEPTDQPTLWIDVTLTCALLTGIRSSTYTANRRLHLNFASVLQFDRPLKSASAQTQHGTPATHFLRTPYQQDDAPLHYFALHFLRKGARVACLLNDAYFRVPGSGIPRLSAQTAPQRHSVNYCAAVPLHSTPPMPYAFTPSFHACAFCLTANSPAKRANRRTSYKMIQNQTKINCTHFVVGPRPRPQVCVRTSRKTPRKPICHPFGR